MNNIITVKNLSKSYGEIKAVNNISFEVEEGSLFAFLGENGAGKSTTINILCTILEKDEGVININGSDLDKESVKVKNSIGIVFQNSVLDKMLTVHENLLTRGALYGKGINDVNKRIEKLDLLLNIKDLLKRKYGTLSGGQKRKIDIVRGLLCEPKILFLDEPTTGLDPKSRIQVWETINTLIKETNLTVFLTTHYMEETDTADKVVILDSGKIVACDTPSNLKQTFSKNVLKLHSPKQDKIDEILKNENLQFTYHNCYMINMSTPKKAKEFIIKHEKLIDDFEFIEGNMDMVFLNATGKELRGEY